MIVLCTHHKGGVGKTELAVHVSGVLREQLGQTLLIDCDSQASAWEFYFKDGPTKELEPAKVDDHLSVVWNHSRKRLKQLAELQETYDHFVLDIDSPLEHTVTTIAQNAPDLVLIPVNLQAGALTKLRDPLEVIKALSKLGALPRVTIVPLGAKLADIHQTLAELDPEIRALPAIAPRVRNLDKETNQARRNRRYAWEQPGCEDLKEYYRTLLTI